MEMLELQGMILTIVIAAMPLLFAALGELVAERSGVLNLGVEGMMAVGAVVGFIAGNATGFCSSDCWRRSLAGWRWQRFSRC